ncbi:MAG: hypothetical protein KDD03_12185 [Gelidibacter sp.]|nr:hypothetical protein [Gelidibacter sp.]
MKPSDYQYLEFYQNLGKLFYGIAAIDGKVHEAEFSKLKQLVKQDWLDIDTSKDDYLSDAAYQIEIVFDWLNDQGECDAKSNFEKFIKFKNKHKQFFTEDIKKLILKTANAIASSFSGKNKSELMMLAKLDMELKAD